jgi:hypothetical protein
LEEKRKVKWKQAVVECGDEIRGQNVQYQPYIGYALFIITKCFYSLLCFLSNSML